MISAEAILTTYKARRDAAGTRMGKMRELRDAYNGDIVVPLPELEKNERAAVANLTAMGIDQLATRIASTMPDVQFPLRRHGFKSEDDRVRDRRQAVLGWWDQNKMGTKLRRRARHLVGYATAPVLVRPDFSLDAPRWELKDPLGTYPGIAADPDDPCVPDCIFAVQRSLAWLKGYYGTAIDTLAKGDNATADTRFDVVEYIDHNELVVCVVGRNVDDSTGGYGINPGARVLELERLENRAGICTAIVPGRINLDRRQGQFDGMIGMHLMQARLMALEVIAVERGIFPDEWLFPDQVGAMPEVIQVADGRRGILGVVKGGQLREHQLRPGYMTAQTVDRLERNQRLTGGIPAEFGGESASNIRTGRRGENVLAATIDFTIQETQQILAGSLEAENARAIAVDKGYHDVRKSFYVSWAGASGPVDYKPSELFETDQQFVTYAQAGADVNNLAIAVGQRVGMGTLSKLSGMKLDPLVENPDAEHDQVIFEALEQALLASTQQQASQGAIPPADLARIMQLVKKDENDLAGAIVKAQTEAQERQAQVAPEGAPETMPGLAQPGMGAEAQGAPGQPPSLEELLFKLRRPQSLSPAERPVPEAVV